MQRVIETMQNDGLVVHEVEPASTSAKFIGLELHHNTFYIKRVKINVPGAESFEVRFKTGVHQRRSFGSAPWAHHLAHDGAP